MELLIKNSKIQVIKKRHYLIVLLYLLKTMIKNILFSLFFFTGIILISILFLPALFLHQNFLLTGGKLMGYWSKICLNFFLSTKVTIKGKEIFIQNQNFFIARYNK